MSQVGKTMVKGHGLRDEGSVWYDQHGNVGTFPWGATPLHAMCRCGALSPAGISQNAAKRWHREHKDEVRAQSV